MSEIWKDIPGYEGYYQASTEGRIRSVPHECRANAFGTTRITKGRILAGSMDTHGYKMVVLSKYGKTRSRKVHRLVAETWLDRDPKRLYVNHKDAVKTNNNISNLEWCTISENALHASSMGLTTKKVIDLDTLEVFPSVTATAEAISSGVAQVTSICKGRRHSLKGRRLAYYDDYLNGTIPPYKRKKYRRKCNGSSTT